MQPEPSRTGAAATRRLSSKSPMQILVNILQGDPTADHNRLFHQWWGQIQSDDELIEAVARHSFTNIMSALDRDRRKPRPQRSESAIEQERRAVSELVERVKNVVLMDLKLPNGKLLRNATFAECSAAGGWFKLLATKGKPSEIVGRVLTEGDLRKLR